ncbi:MAG: RluA family pseudouridine synthase [Clostridia bacterium]|nr:RluA family pseudouridine synthase [Clostridia bacterium]
MFDFTVDANVKLIKALGAKTNLKFGEIRTLLAKKDIKVNGARVGKDVSLKIGDTVTVYAPDTAVKSVKLSDLFSIIYQDDNILVVNKFKGVNSDTVYDKLLSSFTEVYYIHRLDLNTDGIMVFAKNKRSEEELLFGFKNKTFNKYYLALVYGAFDKPQDVLTDYLIKDKDASKVFITKKSDKGSKIITSYKTLKKGRDTSLVEVELLTGKTHQIRAHLAFYGHFIIGDGKYGQSSVNNALGIKKQQLSSYKLTLNFTKEDYLYYLNGKTFTVDKDIKLY